MKYVDECFPDRFIDPECYNCVDPDPLYDIYSLIFSLALKLKRSNANLQTARNLKHKANKIVKLCEKLKVIDYNTINDKRSLWYQTSKTCKVLLKIFKHCETELNVNLVQYFVKYCRKRNNFFYEVAKPIFDGDFCEKFNKSVRENKKNSERQEFLAISRVVTGLTKRQNREVNEQVRQVFCFVLY